MSNNNIIKFDPAIPAQFADSFGPPALLTAEDLQIHNKILCGLFHDVRPQDFFERIFIHDLAYKLCLRLELRRRRVKVIRRANNEKIERQERELLQDAEHRKEELRRLLALDKTLASTWPHSKERQPQTKFAIEQEKKEGETNKKLAEIDAETNKKLAELQKAKDGPIDEAASFDQWIDAVERIDEELALVEQDIRITLKLLEEHRTGLGQRLRQFADEIVDVEFTEEPRPSRGEAVARAGSALNTEVSKASTEPTMGSSVTELPAPALSQTNAGTPARSHALAEPRLPSNGGPAGQQ
jgi:hypothetical protein